MPARTDISTVQTLEKLYKHDSLLDILIEIERFLDNFHIYAYDGWYEGEIVGGPKVEKYWVRIVLMFQDMPDPMAGMALIKHGCKIRVKEGVEVVPVKVKNPSDYRDNGHKKPKMKKEPVWFFEISIPRRFIDEFDIENMNQFEDDIDVDALSAAEDQNLESEGLTDEETDVDIDDEEMEI